MRKRLLSLALALVLCLGLTVPAAAATVTELDPSTYHSLWETYDGLIQLRSGQWSYSYIDTEGNLLFRRDGGPVVFHEGVGVAVRDHVLIDESGNTLFTIPYDKSGSEGYDEHGNQFYEGLLWVHNSAGYGFIDKTGKEVIPCQYDKAKPFFEGLAAVYNADDAYWGYIDKTGNLVLPYQYLDAYNFSERYSGYAWVKLMDSRTTLIDKTGREVIPSGCRWNGWMEKTDRYIYLQDSNGYGQTYDLATGQFVTFPFYDVEEFHEGLAQAKVEDGLAFVNENYEMVFQRDGDIVTNFSGGYAVVQDNGCVFIDRTGKELFSVDTYADQGSSYYTDRALTFSEGLLAVKSNANDRWGFIDASGKEVVPCKYQAVQAFQGGVARVKNQKNKWGLVDTSGNEVVPCEYREPGHLLCVNKDTGLWLLQTGGNGGAPLYVGDTDFYKLVRITGIVPYSTVSSTPSTPAAPSGLTVNPNSSTVLVNGKNVAFDAYTIEGNNYFKLRDLAYVLNGTEKQFEVGWDNTSKTITLTSGQGYTSNGSEMAKSSGAQSASVSNSKLLIDGKEVSLTAYSINGNNYFKLRDIGQAFDFGIGWDNATKTITIDTSTGYTA